MNSKQRRAHIRAALPGALHRLGVLRLMDEIESELADSFAATLRDPRLKLHSLESVVRSIRQIERMNEVRRTLASYVTPGRTVTGRMQSSTVVLQNLPCAGKTYFGASPHTIILDEAATLK